MKLGSTKPNTDIMRSHTHNSFFIWVMGEYGVHESWSKLFSVQFENAVTIDFFGCTSRGEVLVIKGVNPQSKGEQRCNMIVLLDLETSHEKNLVSKTFRI